ncbi:unnamed protein product, partial [Polarella glacialis]
RQWPPYSGLLVEGDSERFAALESRIAAISEKEEQEEESSASSRPQRRLVRTYVTPATVVEVVASALPTSEPDLLK